MRGAGCVCVCVCLCELGNLVLANGCNVYSQTRADQNPPVPSKRRSRARAVERLVRATRLCARRLSVRWTMVPTGYVQHGVVAQSIQDAAAHITRAHHKLTHTRTRIHAHQQTARQPQLQPPHRSAICYEQKSVCKHLPEHCYDHCNVRCGSTCDG